MKYVINTVYGGFSLSDEAIMRYAELKGITLFINKDVSFFNSYYTSPDFDNGSYFRHREIPRNDSVLIQVVEELGRKADGRVAWLVIEEIEPGTRFRLQEYDGMEWIERESEIEWETANG